MKNRIPNINDPIIETADQLIVLRRDEDKRYKTSKWHEYVNVWKKKSVGEKITLSIMFVIFLVYGFTLLFPLLWAIYNSFKPTVEYDMDSIGLPLHWTLENYRIAFTTAAAGRTNIVKAIINSIWMSVLSTFLGIFASCLTSYVVAKYRFRASTLIYTVAIFIQIIPLVGGVTGMYQLLWGTLKIADNPFLIWPIWFGGFGFSFLILYSAFKSVPWSYAESAFIDGASHFATFFKIMLPSVKPILASLFVVNFIGAWNDYMTAYLYMPSWAPLSLAVYLLKDETTRISYPVYLSVVVISIIPILILFVSFQKLIMENTTIGGLKG
ncbi:MAG: carbohydrate ABC transporter permease [Bacilli bacterium]|jgi:raffinose/stachyose/melibiose transport system permease protein/N-acetylglucosamine transport system permease protein